jgi:hypothetical protein
MIKLRNNGKKIEVTARIEKESSGDYLIIKICELPGIASKKISENFEAGINKRGAKIKINVASLPEVPEATRYRRLDHDHDFWPHLGAVKKINFG